MIRSTRLSLSIGSLCRCRWFGTKHKVAAVEDAISLVRDNDTISVSGFVAQGSPETLLRALGDRYRSTGEPKDIELVFGGGPGDYATKGLNHLAQPGLLKRAIGGHYGQVPQIAKMALNNEIEAYCMPLGSISRMLRAAASASPGHISKVGFGTFIDPDQTGGRLNSRSTENIVETVHILGEKYLCYKAIPINVALIRATTGDLEGNLTFEKESLLSDARVIAMAARSSGGVVIAQVERIAESSTLPMKSVHIPGALVDCVVLAERNEDSFQSYFTAYNPSWSGELKPPLSSSYSGDKSLDARKVIARRAVLELKPDDIVNLGIGMPEGVATVAREEGLQQLTTLTTEAGIFGGVGANGRDFGPASNADAMMEMNQQFDFYNGGGLDICFLGMGECSAKGDINVSRLGENTGTLTGPGGFIDISQSTPRVVFMGTFSKKGLKVNYSASEASTSTQEHEDDMDSMSSASLKLEISQEGGIKTFKTKVSEITFSAETALHRGQKVLYITERAVFKLTPKGVELIEIAPGVDIDRDVLAHMDFSPIVDRDNVAIMDSRIFRVDRMGLVDDLMDPHKALVERMEYNPDTHTVYLDLSGLIINDLRALKTFARVLQQEYDNVSQNGDKRFNCVVNYDGLSLGDTLVQKWKELALQLEKKYYCSTTRYAGRAFLRHKLATSIDLKDIDATWKDFIQKQRIERDTDDGNKCSGNGLDRVHLREALLKYHHMRVSEPILNALMEGRSQVTRREFPRLLEKIREYEMQGHLRFIEKN